MKVTPGKLGSDGNFPKFPYNRGEERVRSFWVLRGKGGTWSIERWKQIISLYQTLLRKHIDLIIQQPSEILFPTAIEYLSVERKFFAQLACDHFAFLQEYGFRPDPIVELYGAMYTWISADRGIALLRDYQDGAVSCSIIKLIGGKLPTFEKRELKRDEFIRGTRVEISLDKLLSKQLGITDAEIDMVQNIYTILNVHDSSDLDYTYTSTVIRIYAILVRRYISQLMRAPF